MGNVYARQKSLIDAVMKEDIALVRKYLKHGVNVNEALPLSKYTALMYASNYGLKDILLLLLSHGAVINTGDADGDTALMWALIGEHYECARILVEHGANPCIPDNSGMTPLMYAAALDDTEPILLLLSRINTKNRAVEATKALFVALSTEHPANAKVLIENGADIYSKMELSFNDLKIGDATMLMFACVFGLKDIVLLLLDHEVEVNARAQDGSTALKIAQAMNNDVLAEILIQHGAEC